MVIVIFVNEEGFLWLRPVVLAISIGSVVLSILWGNEILKTGWFKEVCCHR